MLTIESKTCQNFHENIPLRPLSDFDFEGRNATQTLMGKQLLASDCK